MKCSDSASTDIDSTVFIAQLLSDAGTDKDLEGLYG